MTPDPSSSPSPRGVVFRPPWWAVALALAGCAAGIALGNWQWGRAQEKIAAAAAVQRIGLQGKFLPAHTVYLDNKVHRGRPGYHVLQPLQTADGRNVLVNRGWLPAGPDRSLLPALRTPPATVVVEGVRLERLPQAYAPAGARREGAVWQNASAAEVAAWSGLALEPWILEQHSALDDGLARDWMPTSSGAEKNESYALQWYSLAVLSIALLVVLNLKRERSQA
jgi:surfeit locus 1 family protein